MCTVSQRQVAARLGVELIGGDPHPEQAAPVLQLLRPIHLLLGQRACHKLVHHDRHHNVRVRDGQERPAHEHDLP